MKPLFVFDSVVAHLINESSRTQSENIIDEAIERLIADVKARKDYSESSERLFDFISAALNEKFEEGFKSGIQFMTVAVSE